VDFSSLPDHELPFAKPPVSDRFMRIAGIGKSWQFDRKATRAGVQPGCGDRPIFRPKLPLPPLAGYFSYGLLTGNKPEQLSESNLILALLPLQRLQLGPFPRLPLRRHFKQRWPQSKPPP
jgi:hypothetical protein